jgi:hypothetical protein
MQPYLTKIEEHFTGLLPRPQFAKFNLDALLRADTLARYQAHAIALTNGIKTVTEIREHEDMPPLTAAQKNEIKDAKPKPIAVPNQAESDNNVTQLPSAADK